MTRSPYLLAAFVVFIAASTFLAQGDGARATEDGRFTIEVELPRLPVTSQDMTGTCWSFGTMSFLESEVGRVTGNSIDLSEMYPVHFTYLEKARLYVTKGGKNTFGEGGLCHDVIDVIKKYGITPQESYSGLCNGAKKHYHGEMVALLKGMADQMLQARRKSPVWEKAYSAVIQTYLGELPQVVVVDGREMTPVDYARDHLRIPFDDYVEVMSFGDESSFWKYAKLEVPDNWMHFDRYVNVPYADMLAAMDHALAKGYSVAVDMDVSESGFQAGRGLAALAKEDTIEKITDARRMAEFKSGATTDDHLMHVVGIARDAEGGAWYLTKNSWGAVGPYKGYVMMSRPFVALKMLSFMVHKDGLPEGFLAKVQN